jgi:hypothetical protein
MFLFFFACIATTLSITPYCIPGIIIGYSKCKTLFLFLITFKYERRIIT